MGDKTANLITSFRAVFMQFIHTGVQRGSYAVDPQFYVFKDGVYGQGCEYKLIPEKFYDFPDGW